MTGSVRRPIRRVQADTVTDTRDALALEEPLEIRVDDLPLAVTMRTPGHDAQLVLGFLLAEGVIRTAAEVASLDTLGPQRNGNVAQVRLHTPADLRHLSRHVYTTAACGVCGKASIEAVLSGFEPAADGPTVPAAVLHGLPDTLRAAQAEFAHTGALHAAGLFDAHGRLTAVHEDIGRHNAVDKVLGEALQTGRVPLRDHILLVSGRASFEIVHKALAGGIGLVAAISAPSSLAAELAQRGNVTLAGFVRGGSLNLYTPPGRVLTAG